MLGLGTDMRSRKILITGSSGRLGSDMVRILSRNHSIVQFDVREPSDPDQRSLGPIIIGSINDPQAVTQALDGVDTIIHLAAFPGDIPDHYKLVETNVLGTFNLLDLAGPQKNIEHFIYISSICWHGIAEDPLADHMPRFLPFDESHPSLATRYYSCSKVQGEFWCQNYVRRFRKPVVAIRPSWIVPLAQEPLQTAKPNHPYSNLCDYVGTSDLIDGILKAVDYYPPDGFDRFLFHADDQVSTRPTLDLAREYFPGVPVDTEKLNACDGFGAFVDCFHAKERLHWQPRYRCKR